MQIQISTDKNVHGSDELIQRLEAELQSTLSRFSNHITRLEVHLSEEVATGGGGLSCRIWLYGIKAPPAAARRSHLPYGGLRPMADRPPAPLRPAAGGVRRAVATRTRAAAGTSTP
ncbi:hypothetical protein OG738_21805 [Amycolatopsis sp. NBC_01488]|uniref:hypothetical protein n=1 Tax=Amycolatopsis sp. NBC_01488 TaxID=2903563 RepID=UPI002E2B60B2|nr:hypothetical protein [Amycolatopsis sp. NBC_01488]